MKVLHFICPTGFYGAERWILALANNIDAGQVASVLAVTRESSTFPDAFVDEFAALGLPAHALAMNSRFDTGVIARLSTLVRQEKIDIIHTHGYKSDIIGVIVARRTGIVSVSTPHGFEVSRDWKLRAYTWLGAQALKRFDSVVPLSTQLLADIRAYGVDESRIRYIANGVDLKPVFAHAQSSLSVRYGADDAALPELPGRDAAAGDSPQHAAHASTRQAKPLKVGYIGQLIARKNVADILSVFEVLAQDDDAVTLHLLGDGDQRDALEAQARHLPCHDRIHFAGFVDKPLSHLAQFDVFVMTSTLEGVPRCMMESMAMGVPIVAYDIPGVDQLITHDNTGLLAPPGDKAELLKHWKAVLYDSHLAHRIASNAQRHVIKHYSAERMAQEYTQLYQRLLG